MPKTPPLAALLAALALAPRAAAAAPVLVAAFEDAAHDADGPGGYTPPGDTSFTEGDFDLRRLAVWVDGEDVLFEVTLGAPLRQPEVTIRSGSTPLPLDNGITLQNIDIYLDTDPASPAGWCVALPGRRVAFPEGRTWKAAVVLTPRPGPAREVTREALGPAADRIVFAERLRIQGRTVTARVPAALLGGAPAPSWGYSVQVSGAAWEPSYQVAARVAGRHAPDAFTMPVKTTPEAWAFGGGPLGDLHPQVVDVLLPPWLDQHAVLGAYGARAAGGGAAAPAGGGSQGPAYARVPFLTAGEKAPPPAPAASAVAAPSAAPSPSAPAPGPAAGTAASPATGAGTAKGTTEPLPAALAPSLSALSLPGAPSAAPAADASPAPAAPLLVEDVSDDLVSATGPVVGLKPMQFGRVLDASGMTVARVMILRLLEKGLVATAVDGRAHIKKGARLRFDDGPTTSPPGAPAAKPGPGAKGAAPQAAPPRPTP